MNCQMRGIKRCPKCGKELNNTTIVKKTIKTKRFEVTFDSCVWCGMYLEEPSYPCGNRSSCDIGVSDRERCSHYDECFPEEESLKK